MFLTSAPLSPNQPSYPRQKAIQAINHDHSAAIAGVGDGDGLQL